jgi:hypothetical protein
MFMSWQREDDAMDNAEKISSLGRIDIIAAVARLIDRMISVRRFRRGPEPLSPHLRADCGLPPLEIGNRRGIDWHP